MSKINLNNPIKILLPISLEIEEFKMQEKMNHLGKKNLESLFKKMKEKNKREFYLHY